ncbi:MAG: DUF1028 domain-containing protein [Phycisphaerales bacterium]|nr:MAG: DUF1028 domain-containing protein [Phycisphaerales bacterium]
MARNIFALICSLVVAAAFAAPSAATWSIVICDEQTDEVAIGTVTCLNNYDLLAIVPVVVVGKGAGACQAAGDFNGIRRPIIFDNLIIGTPPEEILDLLAGITGHQQRQYGIVDTQGRMITFTGSQTYPWAGGVVGSLGSMYYAVQGNVLAGECVIDEIESALLNTPGDIPEKLMAGMYAAYAVGGDGRCSCYPNNPTGCGCPVPDFDKSGHIGGMVVARIGDVDDDVCNAGGCADGDYFMRFNVAYQNDAQPDPVLQLQDLFDAWRADLLGRPDAIQTTVVFDPPRIPPNGLAQTTFTITPLDWQGQPVTADIDSLTVEHADDSAGISAIGEVIDNGDGTWSVVLTAGNYCGIDLFVVTIDDGIRPVILMPEPMLEYCCRADIDCSREVDIDDVFAVLANWGPCDSCLEDVNGDGMVDIDDIFAVLADWGPCG